MQEKVTVTVGECEVISTGLVVPYRAMGADKAREAEAYEWAEATVSDVERETG